MIDEVILDAAIVGMLHAVEHLDHRTDVDRQPGFFEHFARDRRLERLAELHAAAGQAPFALQRLVRAPGQQHVAFAVEHDRADADNRVDRETSSVPHFLSPQIFPSP